MSDIAERLRRLPADTRTCLAFFSRLPVSRFPGAAPEGPFDLRAAAGAWPLAGAILALPAAFVLVVAATLTLPPLVAALLALATLAAVTGALHEDGLADLADSAGGRDREARLAIMRDSRIGTFGVLALLVSFGIRAGALAAIVAADPWRGALALVLVAVLARAAALWHWHGTEPARPDGLARSAGKPESAALTVAAALAGFAALGALAGFGFAGILALILAAGGALAFSRVALRLVGGHTGDTIGASEQVAEALLFAGLSAGAAL